MTTTPSFVPDQQTITPLAPTAPQPLCHHRSVWGTLGIIAGTIICTIAAEIVLGVFLVSYGLKKVMQYAAPITAESEAQTTPTEKTGSSVPLNLTSEQKALFASLGIKPDELPAGVTPQKITCAVNAIGETRVAALIAGKVTPGLSDLLKAKSCF